MYRSKDRPRCAAGVYDERGSFADHPCPNYARTERAVRVGPSGVERIPVCRLHARQKRRDFHEYKEK